jgi:hypothetical protein
MKRLVALVAVAAVLAAPAGAAAYTGWHWSTAEAERALVRVGLNWTNTGKDAVQRAKCFGIGEPFISDGRVLWARMNCKVWAIELASGEKDRYWIRFIVKGKNKWDYKFLRYD